MRTALRPLRLGNALCLAIALLISGCRKDVAPTIEVCILAPGGGAACVEKDGTHRFKVPSELVNYWATNPGDQAAFASFCYSTSVGVIKQAMDAKESEIKGYPVEVVHELAP